MNGPALARDGSQVAVAWFTRGDDDKGRVKLKISSDSGRAFQAPIVIDDAEPLGRVGVAVLRSGRVLVSWLGLEGDHAQVLVRVIESDGTPGETAVIAACDPSRAVGVPAIAASGDQTVIAWRDLADGQPVVKTAIIHVQ